ncbi:MAG: ferric reductase-like transmembrane domain-containing protein, partial [Propionibacteriaceae bacterium]|nr:ferric reductase-like transmembrane domain-containing protein [Propionibacteriaceae bacterium]
MNPASAWRGETQIAPGQLRARRALLVAVIAVTSLLPLVFVTPEDVPVAVNVYKYLAKIGAFVGSMLLVWQILLGFRGLVSSVLPDLTWVVSVHKALGQFGVPIIVLHPVFIGLYYLAKEERNIYALDLGRPFDQFVLLGMVTLALIAFVIITSAFFRDKLGFYPWLYTHLSTYLVPPFLLVHSFALGQTIEGSGLRWYWWGVTAVVVVALAVRVLHKLGIASDRYRVVGTRSVAEATTEVTLEPVGAPLEPAPGQFIYLRRALGENSHPYTVSGLSGRALSVTVQDEGGQTAALQEASVGDEVLLDGPFGVFTRVSLAKELPLVMIAGGVGITAFRRLWQRLEDEASREAYLFYGNETFEQIVYRDELDALEHVQVVHVLHDEPDYDGEQGLVDLDVLTRHLSEDVTEYQFLVCGPPVMIESLEELLTEA